MKKSKSVNDYLDMHPERILALRILRKILCATELEETIKWGGPCYAGEGKTRGLRQWCFDDET